MVKVNNNSKMRKKEADPTFKGVVFDWIYDRNIKKQYLCIVFKRNLEAQEVSKCIKQILEYSQIKIIEGARYF